MILKKSWPLLLLKSKKRTGGIHIPGHGKDHRSLSQHPLKSVHEIPYCGQLPIDSDSGKSEQCHSGDFEAIEEKHLRLVDGGIVDQVPAEIARAMGADIVIGVSLGFAQFFEKPKHPNQSFSNLLELMSREGIAHSLSLADIAIEIPGIEKNSLLDMEQRETLIAHGKAAMRDRLEDLIRRVENFKRRDGQG